ncbi:hemin uptake protein HemP [Wenzhouxiangella sp. XN79A]|uniref:hemin uptake protein HemP n=1 Tax=Wenzhouxiangella sp. XN79A TaxID=2724193 RepID=UPI003217CBF0
MSHPSPSSSRALRTSRRTGERTSGGPDEIDSQLLLGSGKRVLIQHRGQTYELRETRQGKLILTK